MENPLAIFSTAQEFATSLTILLATYGGFAVFVSVFLTGETAIFIAFMLAEQGTLPFELVFISATLATLLADLFWFTAGRYFPERWLPARLKHSLVMPLEKVFTDLFRGQQFLPILLLKFFIGTRIVVLIYFARQKISLLRFFIYNTLSIVFFLTVLAILGIIFGRVIEVAVPAYKTFATIFTSILVVVVVSQLVRARLREEK